MKTTTRKPLRGRFGLVLLVLVLAVFPGLAALLAVPASAVLVWAAAQPVIVGAVLGAMVWPRVHGRAGVRS
ncbi:hypothetical protein [Streptomyces jumonjinensis]|uniref:hypothetical protein n=1 Tax=Streptomyces jumonjinensis TaxID=1945 RepID=UPI0037B88010